MSWRSRVLTLLTVLVSATGTSAALLIPVNVGAATVAQRVSSATPATATAGTAFSGVSAVGVLFTAGTTGLGNHLCTASVVHSAHRDLAVTAAHCLANIQGQIVFVPGYENGKEPYGAWAVTAVYTDQAWQSSQDPDDDIAFLRLSDSVGGKPVEDVTGAERLATPPAKPELVRVIGYPDDTEQPISCVNWAHRFSATQLEFDCDGFTDGTSGGPFLVAPNAKGRGTIIGVIGGYEQGGDTAEVSYAVAFGAAVTALYRQAEAAG